MSIGFSRYDDGKGAFTPLLGKGSLFYYIIEYREDSADIMMVKGFYSVIG